MPEMPEVETVRRILEPQLVGQSILSVSVTNPQVIACPDAETFAARLTGQRVLRLSRRGKFLTIQLESGDRVALHLRMTGRLLVTPAEAPVEKHTHIAAQLSGGAQLRYIDVRRFGRFWLLPAGARDEVTGQEKLGLEPLDDALTGDYLRHRLGGRGKAVKEMLLDQSVVAGIGNIYSDEILFAAGIHPAERCQNLEAGDWQRLAERIREVILWGIAADAMTAAEYLAGGGREYRNISGLRVYGRAGQPCPLCRSTLEKTLIGGRGSCYCPDCQKKKP